MKVINKIIPSLLVVSSLVYSDIGVDSIGINVGYEKMNNKQLDKRGSITLPTSLDESFTQVELYTLIGGVFDDDSWKPTINYIYATNDDFENDILAIGINKYMTFGEFDIYGGLLGGMGRLMWERNPINNAKDIDYKSSSFVAIAQAGAEYEITKQLLVGLHAKYYLNNYNADLQPTNTTQTTITHDNGYSLSVGLRFRFETSDQTEKSVPTPTEEEPKVVEEPKAEVVPVIVPVVVPKDSDNDGVIDISDNCSDTLMDVKVDKYGCALDLDNDGIPDYRDSCSNTPTDVKVDGSGCAVDSDNDGIADYKDSCLDTPTDAKVDESGCAVDSDNDGIADYKDNCSDTPTGFSVDENGCEVAYDLHIKFPSSSAEILPEYEATIGVFADFLNRFPDYKAVVKAYSDTSGDSRRNKRLSQKRAKSVYDALINQGISADRLSHVGMGEQDPIASNDTKEGRDKNRRVEAVLVK